MPLNPTLLAKLESLSAVTIEKPDRQQQELTSPDWSRRGHLRSHILDWGETYCVRCPRCGSGELRVGHRFMTHTRTGQVARELLECSTPGCMSEADWEQLHRALLRPAAGQDSASTPAQQAQPPAIELPQGCVPLDELPSSHPACEHLHRRGFDPLEVTRKWGVLYCESGWDCRPPVVDRLVIPVYQPETHAYSTSTRPVLAGWQARDLAEDSPWPKYLSPKGMHKNRLLYNLPTAIRTTGPVLLVEGTTDVWRAGDNAVALFGKSLSRYQALLVRERFVGRPIVVMLDSDALADAQETCHKLQQSRQHDGGDTRVLVARLPAGQDPADSTESEIAAAIERALAT